NDFNPEKIQIDENQDILADFEFPEINPGARLEDITGVLGYDFGNYQIFPTEAFSVLQASDLQPEITSITPANDLLRIASYNVLNLDAKVEDINQVNNQEARNVDDDLGNGRFQKIARQIVNNLKVPDIIALQEIQDNDGGEVSNVTAADLTLQTLVDIIKENQGPEYAFVDNPFVVAGAVGGQPGGNIRTAFLYNPQRVELVEGSIRSIAAENQSTNERNPFFRARLPLVADFTFQSQKVTLINNHFSSKGGSAPILGTEQPFETLQEDAAVNGSLDERRDQAIAVKRYVEDILAENAQANIVVMGDFNEFEFVSPLRDILGACLANLTDRLPQSERYTFSFQGNAQALDHMLISPALEDKSSYSPVSLNSEFTHTKATASDHDPVLLGLNFGESSGSPGGGLPLATFTPKKDAFLSAQGGVNNTQVQLKDQPNAEIGFFQFDMQVGQGPVRKAELVLYTIAQENASANLPVEVLVFLGEAKDWDEDQLTATNRPDTLGEPLGRIKTIFHANIPYTFTLDISRLDFSRPINLVLYLKAPENHRLVFASKEHPSGLKAQMKLTLAPSSSNQSTSQERDKDTSLGFGFPRNKESKNEAIRQVILSVMTEPK
ncbi:MAG: endonuclease/exonuclease/phosphatase family protein, partial [Bacteroidota bacterium]